MSTSQLNHTQGIRNFHHIKYEYVKDHVLWTITRAPTKFSCSTCNSSRVTATRTGIREIKGLPIGSKKTVFHVIMHRLKCHECGAFRKEKLDFLPQPKCHYTKLVAERAISLRSEMTITAVAADLGLAWDTVKEIEKEHLRKKYEYISLRQVRDIGIDEVHIGGKNFLTIVRNIRNGDVLFVGDGKSGESLAPFAKKLKRCKHKITSVAIDLGAAYTAWVKEHLCQARIVYDKFHVIKLMNDKLNAVRRRTMNKLAEDEKAILKGQRYTLLRNEEDLTQEAEGQLHQIRATFEDLGTMSFMKECLRNVYMIAEWEEHARIGFLRWVSLAQEAGVAELKTMAKTIRNKLDGIVGFWINKITSASMEGFNNKIGWLNRQAYGYRDHEYLKLKIYDLPKTRTEKKL